MNRRYSAIAVSALALGGAALTVTEASARLDPDPGSGYTTTPDCHWAYHPACDEVLVPVPPVEAALDPGSSDDNGAETMRAGASALGGAGLAFGGLWLYRRRHAPAA
ncbi:hypothetical protein EV642_128102 [Kribbella sp. VKM Ac-2500]|nr:hypothetical protein EV642_128102 [Kribbella sp. VKM Ac-2500]